MYERSSIIETKKKSKKFLLNSHSLAKKSIVSFFIMTILSLFCQEQRKMIKFLFTSVIDLDFYLDFYLDISKYICTYFF